MITRSKFDILFDFVFNYSNFHILGLNAHLVIVISKSDSDAINANFAVARCLKHLCLGGSSYEKYGIHAAAKGDTGRPPV